MFINTALTIDRLRRGVLRAGIDLRNQAEHRSAYQGFQQGGAGPPALMIFHEGHWRQWLLRLINMRHYIVGAVPIIRLGAKYVKSLGQDCSTIRLIAGLSITNNSSSAFHQFLEIGLVAEH